MQNFKSTQRGKERTQVLFVKHYLTIFNESYFESYDSNDIFDFLCILQ